MSDWKKCTPTSGPTLQVTMEAARNTSQTESVKLFDLLYQNVSFTAREPATESTPKACSVFQKN